MKITLRRLASPFLVIAVAVAAGCSSAGRSGDPFRGGQAAREGQIRISVENQNFGDATIHALRGGERVRLGDVTGKSDKQFDLRWNFSLDIEFEINLVGGGSCRVRPMAVAPGDQVWLRIPTQIRATPCISGKR